MFNVCSNLNYCYYYAVSGVLYFRDSSRRILAFQFRGDILEIEGDNQSNHWRQRSNSYTHHATLLERWHGEMNLCRVLCAGGAARV